MPSRSRTTCPSPAPTPAPACLGARLRDWCRQALLCGLALLCIGPALAQAEVQRIDQALSADGAGDSFPTRAATRPVKLPDDWAQTRPGRGGPVWYRVAFDPPRAPAGGHAAQSWAVLVAHACAQLVVVQLNGHRVYGSGAPAAEMRHCGLPQLVVLPPALLLPQGNQIDLQLAGPQLGEVGSRQRSAALSPLSAGPLALMQAELRWQTLLRVTLPQALDATLLLLGGFLVVLGLSDRRERLPACFGALSIGWALLDLPLWLPHPPWPQAVTEGVLVSLLALVGGAAVQFLLRCARWRHRLVDHGLLLQAALVPLTLLAAGGAQVHPLAQAWGGLLVLQVLAAASLYLQRQWRERSVSFWLLCALLAAAALSGVLWGAVEFGALDQTVPSPPLLLARLLLPLMLVLVGLRLVQQHGRARQQAELNQAVLEQRVREATAEVERNFHQRSELRIEQITERERKRIAADLHDDLGAKLLTIVHTSESDRISTLAREALEEMRLSVRGLTGRAVRLGDALGDWRAEVVSRLAQAGIEADWTAPDDLPQTLSARAYVQTTRILREATSNIIKHSGASHCEVRCQVAEGDFQLVLHDNGDGISGEADRRLDRGHGMATMKQRAKQMQGQCLVESGPGLGTVIRLTLPLDRALEGA